MTAVRIPLHLLDDAWPEVEPMVAAAVAHSANAYRVEHVRDLVARDDWQLWSDGKSIACSAIVEYPVRRMLYITLAAGDLSGVKTMWPVLVKFAKANDCGAIQWRGRPGWKRSGVLPPEARLTHEIMTAELG